MVRYIEHHGNPQGIGFAKLIREDYVTNGRDWSAPGFRAIAVHRFGNWRMEVSSKLVRAPLSVVYRTLFRFVRNHYGIELPYTVKLGRRVSIDHQSGIVIHGATVVGDDCRIRQNTTLGVRTVNDLHGAPVLGTGVDIGAGAVVVGRISVGDGASIGANAVVLHDVPAGALVVGIPAKVVQRSAAASA